MGEDLRHRHPLAPLRAALVYAAGEAGAAFRRNGLMTVAAVTTIMVTLVPVGVAVVLAANLRLMAAVLERQVQVVVYLRDDLPAAGRRQVLADVAGLAGVRRVEFVGRDQALRRLQEALGERVSLRDVIETNPLPDSLEVTLADPRRAQEVAAAVRSVTGVEDVTFGAAVLDRLLAVTAVLRGSGAAAALLLGGVALIIIMNTIRLTILGRRQEIEIMQLVGAGGWYVRSPFLLEGVLQGVVATALAVLLLVPGYLLVLERAQRLVPFLPVVEPAAVLPPLVLVLILGGALVGMSGSLLALRRFLHA